MDRWMVQNEARRKCLTSHLHSPSVCHGWPKITPFQHTCQRLWWHGDQKSSEKPSCLARDHRLLRQMSAPTICGQINPAKGQTFIKNNSAMQRDSSVFAMEYQASSLLKNGGSGLWHKNGGSGLWQVHYQHGKFITKRKAPKAIGTKPMAM